MELVPRCVKADDDAKQITGPDGNKYFIPSKTVASSDREDELFRLRTKLLLAAIGSRGHEPAPLLDDV